MRKKRPPLSAVMATPPSTPAPTERRRRGRRAAGHVQLTVLIPPELRDRAKIRALEQHKDLSDVIAELLGAWVKA